MRSRAKGARWGGLKDAEVEGDERTKYIAYTNGRAEHECVAKRYRVKLHFSSFRKGLHVEARWDGVRCGEGFLLPLLL